MAGWVLECQSLGKRVAGIRRSLGIVVNTYQLELSSLYAILAYTNTLTVVYLVWSGKVLIACNNIAALRKSLDCNQHVRSPIIHGDIIRAIRWYRHMIPVNIALMYEHVRGHQDRGTAYKDIMRIAQLNVKMYTWANSFLEAQIIKPNCIGDYFHGTLLVVRIESLTAHTTIGHILRFNVGLRECQASLMNKQFNSEDAFDAVDWKRSDQQTVQLQYYSASGQQSTFPDSTQRTKWDSTGEFLIIPNVRDAMNP